MLSYKAIAELTGATVREVREAMSRAERFELPTVRTVDLPGHFAQVQTVDIERYWAVVDEGAVGCPRHVRQSQVCGTGRTREEAVIAHLSNR